MSSGEATIPAAATGSGQVLDVRMLPARQGDCLLVEWSTDGRPFRMLVDAGPARAYTAISEQLAALEEPRIDLLVLTHVDADHVEGTILLTNDRGLGLSFGEVWFNSSGHLAERMGPVQGEILSAIIQTRGLRWNAAFDGRAVRSSDEGPLPVVDLPGGVRATVLAPDRETLLQLLPLWKSACREAGIAAGSVEDALALLERRRTIVPEDAWLSGGGTLDVEKLARNRTGTDLSATNASSVVLLLERGGQRVLLTGDATPPVLLPAVRRLLEERGSPTLPLTDLKVPHHGSSNNITAEMVRLLPAERYLISSDGSKYNHPDDGAVATILVHGPRGLELVFSHDTPRNRRWAQPALIEKFGHRVSFAHRDGPHG